MSYNFFFSLKLCKIYLGCWDKGYPNLIYNTCDFKVQHPSLGFRAYHSGYLTVFLETRLGCLREQTLAQLTVPIP